MGIFVLSKNKFWEIIIKKDVFSFLQLHNNLSIFLINLQEKNLGNIIPALHLINFFLVKDGIREKAQRKIPMCGLKIRPFSNSEFFFLKKISHKNSLLLNLQKKIIINICLFHKLIISCFGDFNEFLCVQDVPRKVCEPDLNSKQL